MQVCIINYKEARGKKTYIYIYIEQHNYLTLANFNRIRFSCWISDDILGVLMMQSLDSQ